MGRPRDTPEAPDALHASSPRELLQRIEAEREGRTFLLYRDDEGRQQLFPLGHDMSRVVVGRDPDADLRLPWDIQVSRLHAELERIGRHWTVIDEGLSLNGTFLNGERVTGRRRLADGDMLRFGSTVAVLHAPREDERTRTVGGQAVAPAEVTEMQRRVLISLCRPLAHAGPFAAPATNQQIAEEMCLSVAAVKSHLRELFRKFDVGELPQQQKRLRLVELAFQSGAVTERDLLPRT